MFSSSSIVLNTSVLNLLELKPLEVLYICSSNSQFLDLLKRDVKRKKVRDGEIGLTSVLDEIREKSGMVAFIPNGEMYDMGNIRGYMETLINKAK